MICKEQKSLSSGLFDCQPPFLAELVKRYRVCWEVWPEYSMVDGQEKLVGFELTLSGTHESATQHTGPGCLSCRRIYSALHSLTEWVFPQEEQPSIYQSRSYEAALRYSAVRGSQAALAVKIEVTLKVKIVLLKKFEQPADECEKRCRETKEHLSELGTCERPWSLRSADGCEQIHKQSEPAQYRAAAGQFLRNPQCTTSDGRRFL